VAVTALAQRNTPREEPGERSIDIAQRNMYEWTRIRRRARSESFTEGGDPVSSESSAVALNAETIRQYETEYVLYPWMFQKGLNPVVMDRAEGNYFYDAAGKKYLDFSAQFVFSNLGHGDDRMVEAISQQARRLENAASPFATEPKARLAKLLAEISPGDIKRVFFSTSGAEANEGAIKLARMATGREKILSRWGGYHGSTLGPWPSPTITGTGPASPPYQAWSIAWARTAIVARSGLRTRPAICSAPNTWRMW
jgi:hypothetical protein